MSQPPPSGDGPKDISSELESFRQQWRAEVKAKVAPSGSSRKPPQASPSAAGSSSAAAAAPTITKSAAPVVAATATAAAQAAPRPGLRRGSSAAGGPQTPLKLLSSGKKLFAQENDDDYAQPRAFDDEVRTVAPPVNPAVATSELSLFDADTAKKEPKSALEHYEKAVEKEAMGSLGDSLKHYRTAFRVCLLSEGHWGKGSTANNNLDGQHRGQKVQEQALPNSTARSSVSQWCWSIVSNMDNGDNGDRKGGRRACGRRKGSCRAGEARPRRPAADAQRTHHVVWRARYRRCSAAC